MKSIKYLSNKLDDLKKTDPFFGRYIEAILSSLDECPEIVEEMWENMEEWFLENYEEANE